MLDSQDLFGYLDGSIGLPKPQFLPPMAPSSQTQCTLLGYIRIRLKYWVYVILMRLGALEVSFSSRLKTCELQLKDELQLMQRAFSPLLSFPYLQRSFFRYPPLPRLLKALSHEIFERLSANIAKAFSACSIQDLNEFEWLWINQLSTRNERVMVGNGQSLAISHTDSISSLIPSSSLLYQMA
ncbi:hypothetical protein AAG906_018395 [Vitis piasezkii]